MAGVDRRVQVRQGLLNHISTVRQLLMEHVKESAEDATREGLAAARVVIATTPSSIVANKHNRIDTGLMYNSLERDIKGTQRVTLRVGWLRKKENYFKTQDQGGVNDWGVNITPMHALAAAKITMKERLADRGIK
jgi:hypothetical protein